MPYLVNDIFIRDAFNEIFIFIFMPMISNGIVNLIKNKPLSFYLYFVVGYIGIVNSHLVLSIYFTFLLIIIILLNIKKLLTKDNLKHLIKASLIILLFILPSIILMIEHKNLGIYRVFDLEVMGSTASHVKKYGIYLFELIIPWINKNNGIFLFINIAVLILSVIGVIEFMKKRKNNTIVKGIISFTIVSIVLSLKYFPYQIIPKILLSIQFAFRNMAFVCFGFTILSTYGLMQIKKYSIKKVANIVIIFSCTAILSFILTSNFINKNTINYNSKISGMGHQKEYLPQKAKDNYYYFKTRESDIKANKNIKIDITKNKTPYLEFKIENLEENETATIELPRLYYLGYVITEETSNDIIKLDYKCNKNGFISINIDQNGIIKVKYKGTKLYNIARIIRFLVLNVLIIYLIIKMKNKKFYI